MISGFFETLTNFQSFSERQDNFLKIIDPNRTKSVIKDGGCGKLILVNDFSLKYM